MTVERQYARNIVDAENIHARAKKGTINSGIAASCKCII